MIYWMILDNANGLARCTRPFMKGGMNERMWGFCRGRETRFGFARSEERSHEPDKSVLLGWKNALETFLTVTKESKGQERVEKGGSPREMRTSAPVGTKSRRGSFVTCVDFANLQRLNHLQLPSKSPSVQAEGRL